MMARHQNVGVDRLAAFPQAVLDRRFPVAGDEEGCLPRINPQAEGGVVEVVRLRDKAVEQRGG